MAALAAVKAKKAVLIETDVIATRVDVFDTMATDAIEEQFLTANKPKDDGPISVDLSKFGIVRDCAAPARLLRSSSSKRCRSKKSN